MLLLMSPLAALACASVPAPNDLMDARVAYERAASGPASQLAPAQLQVAHDELAAAETSYLQDGDSYRTRDLAYVAVRKAQLADATARTVELNEKANLAERQVQLTQAEVAANATSALRSTEAELQTQKERLNEETQRREAAESRAQQALADLAQIAAVRQDGRGTVITIPGEVLFASGKYDLLPTAQATLAQVADALTRSDPDSTIDVGGYTDSQGNATFNLELSQHRADAVRLYLVSRGVAPDRITARGFGETQPVTSNESPEGRANNRRVEIVIHPKSRLPGAIR